MQNYSLFNQIVLVGYTSLPNYDPNTSLRLGEDRGSVHSGRSSANGEAIKDRYVNNSLVLLTLHAFRFVIQLH